MLLARIDFVFASYGSVDQLLSVLVWNLFFYETSVVPFERFVDARNAILRSTY